MKPNARSTKVCLMLGLVAALAAWPAMAQEEGDESPEPNWVNSLGLSYVGTSGNTDTSSLGLDFKSTRKPTPWGLDFSASFTRADDNGVTTAEQYYVGGRGIRALNDRWSIFVGLAWARDPFTGFDNRWLAEGGAEFVAVKSEKHRLAFDAGLSWNSEDQIFFDEVAMEEYTETVDWFGGVAGLTWDWAISKNASLSQRLLYHPNFDDTSDWRAGSDTAVTASLTKLLALKFNYLVRYRNQPIGENEKTDTTTKASVVLNF
jgi:putative salt-induced outer membrane protein